jgi:hypothetical protein
LHNPNEYVPLNVGYVRDVSDAQRNVFRYVRDVSDAQKNVFRYVRDVSDAQKDVFDAQKTVITCYLQSNHYHSYECLLIRTDPCNPHFHPLLDTEVRIL